MIYLLALIPVLLVITLVVLLRRRRPHILIDGSNVMHWRDNSPSLEPVRAVVTLTKKAGFTPGVVFDANAGYKLEGRYRDDRHLARALGLPEAQVLVVSKGQQADPVLLAVARDRGARIVTNDRFRDWAAPHPEIATPGHLIRGGWRDGAVWLDLGEE
ncbi:Zc3h12a-like ribonuclease protein [Rhodobacter viridis]|uniref:Zc3h12a-like ribonuclease protein n=1 Tax=Rhodobacter viridis TaxID=1054202 RepID=A0A318U3U2_9RHOB|nr:hypothetical protein [Rhodobacter viridis]PYF10229.1 Zc3h12a-like ribonuclease protein [Rhodobacter viridis]